VSLLVNLALGNQALFARVSGPLAFSALGLARTAVATSSSANGGNLAGPWVESRGQSALEVHISVFNGVELSE